MSDQSDSDFVEETLVVPNPELLEPSPEGLATEASEIALWLASLVP